MILFLVIINLRTQNLIFSLLVTLMYSLLLYYTVYTYRSYYLYKAKTCTTIKRVTNMGINIIDVKNLANSRTLFFYIETRIQRIHWLICQLIPTNKVNITGILIGINFKIEKITMKLVLQQSFKIFNDKMSIP